MTHSETIKLSKLMEKHGINDVLQEISGLLDEAHEYEKADDLDDIIEKWEDLK